MDAQQCWDDILDALQRRNWEQASESADSLYAWLTKRGAPPVTVGDQSLGVEWHRTIACFVCLHVANKVADIKIRRADSELSPDQGGE